MRQEQLDKLEFGGESPLTIRARCSTFFDTAPNTFVGGGAFDAPLFLFVSAYQRAAVGASPYSTNKQQLDKLEFGVIQSNFVFAQIMFCIQPYN